MAARIIGTPQRMMAIQAASKGEGKKIEAADNQASPEMTRKTMSLLVPPSSRSFSRGFIVVSYTYGGIGILQGEEWVKENCPVP